MSVGDPEQSLPPGDFVHININIEIKAISTEVDKAIQLIFHEDT